jgi:methenyltetrahydromethanopterin cyclohydrolase
MVKYAIGKAPVAKILMDVLKMAIGNRNTNDLIHHLIVN